jgi:hypothetical protein
VPELFIKIADTSLKKTLLSILSALFTFQADQSHSIGFVYPSGEPNSVRLLCCVNNPGVKPSGRKWDSSLKKVDMAQKFDKSSQKGYKES